MASAKELYPRRYYPYLDGFRAISIIWVLCHHIFIGFDPTPYLKPIFIPALLFGRLGILGVDMFFVISGFLITGLLIQDLDGPIRLKRFYLRRIFKIIPPYFCTVLGGILVLYFVQSFTFPSYSLKQFHPDSIDISVYKFNTHFNTSLIGNYFLFIQNFKPHLATLQHTWSIAIEEHFYIIYPLVVFAISKITPDFLKRRRYLLLALLVLVVCVNTYRYACAFHWKIFPYQTTFFRFDSLIFGCLLRILEPNIHKIDIKKHGFLAPFCLICGILIYGSIFYRTYLLYTINLMSPYITMYMFIAYYLAPGLIILSAMMGFKPLINIMSNKTLINIGKNSYGIYLWHYVILFPFILLQKYLPTPLVIILYFIGSIFIGILSTETIEKYFLKLRKQYIP